MSIRLGLRAKRIRAFGLVGGPVQVGVGCAERLECPAGLMFFHLLLLGVAARGCQGARQSQGIGTMSLGWASVWKAGGHVLGPLLPMEALSAGLLAPVRLPRAGWDQD